LIYTFIVTVMIIKQFAD